MRLRDRVTAWQGVLLCLVAVAASIWLGLSGKLALYIHPRYVVFTITMAVIAAVLIAAAFALRPDRHSHSEPGDNGDDARAGEGRRSAIGAAGSVLLVVAAAVALLVLPPTTLTSTTAADRDINGGAVLADDLDLVAVGSDYTRFSVKEWAALLRQVSSPTFYENKMADVVGFVLADRDDPENVFYVSRFVVTCCAVDAQPIGVPVYSPGWQDDLDESGWVRVIGSFGANPAGGGTPVVVVPDSVREVPEPDDPYVH